MLPAYMYNYDGFKYFLLVVDGFSSKIFVRPLISKDSSIVAKALEDMWKIEFYKTKSQNWNFWWLNIR